MELHLFFCFLCSGVPCARYGTDRPPSFAVSLSWGLKGGNPGHYCRLARRMMMSIGFFIDLIEVLTDGNVREYA